MAITQGEYFDAIGRAGLVWSDNVLANINKEKSGCQPCWDNLFCEFKQIECAEYFFRLGDYAVSDDSIFFYNRMLSIAGSQYSDAILDPNLQLPGTGIVIEVSGPSAINLPYNETDLIDGGGGNWYLPLVDKTQSIPYPPLPVDYKPVLLTVNGVSFTVTYDSTFSPTRLYGFSTNAGPQVIIVTVVTTT